MDGIIVERLAEAGSTVVAGTPIFRMVDPTTLWVATRVDESVVGRVQRRPAGGIRLRSGETLTGKVARIARQSDAATRELEVDVAFDAPLPRFAIDQEAEVAIAVGEERGIVVPLAALTATTRASRACWWSRAGARASSRVETGAAPMAGRVLVRKGLSRREIRRGRAAGASTGACGGLGAAH